LQYINIHIYLNFFFTLVIRAFVVVIVW